jgi:hypothetical protein
VEIGEPPASAQEFAEHKRRPPFGHYVNFLGEEGQDRVRAAYGATKYDRLRALKTKYDPTNLFRVNQNIAP